MAEHSSSEESRASASGLLLELSHMLSEHGRKLAKKPKPSNVSEAADVWARASKMQKALKQGKSSSVRSQDVADDYIMITVCEMAETSTGFRLKNKGISVEIQAQRSDRYFDVALKAASGLKLRSEPHGSLCLFKVFGGAKILNEDLVVNKIPRAWTLGNYLSLQKKGPSNVKFGVAYVIDSPESTFSTGYSLGKRTRTTQRENSQSKVRKMSYKVTESVRTKGTTKENPLLIDSGHGPSISPVAEAIEMKVATSVLQFTEDELKKATDEFSADNKLGEGGFGEVYKGFLNGSFVAVKRLSKSGAKEIAGTVYENPIEQEKQLLTEITALSRCRHKNLVDLMGFCSTPPMIVYEFMEKGNLHFWIHKSAVVLSWQQRSKVLKDVCRGLLWLHSAQPPMLHGDLKPSNILIDAHFNAKIGDFGFTVEVPEMKSETVVLKTAACIAKTLGYTAPEIDTSRHSVKSDVFSYGVICLETFTGLKAYDKKREDPLLVEHLEEEIKSKEALAGVASLDAGDISPYLLLIYVRVITSCLKKHSNRPSSKEVMSWWNETNF